MPDAPMTEADLAEIEARAAMRPDAVVWRVPAFLYQVRLDMTTSAAALRRSWAENADLKAALAKTVEIAKAAMLAEGEWRPIEEAPKDLTPIWAVLRDDIYPRLMPGRDDLTRWNGRQIPVWHPGIAEDGFDIGWAVAAPVGHGGFPDEWIAGWRPLPAPPVSPEAREKALERLAEVEAGVV